MSTSPGKRVVEVVGTFMTASEVVVVKSLVVGEEVVAIALTLLLLSLVLLPMTNISAVTARYAFIVNLGLFLSCSLRFM